MHLNFSLVTTSPLAIDFLAFACVILEMKRQVWNSSGSKAYATDTDVLAYDMSFASCLYITSVIVVIMLYKHYFTFKLQIINNGCSCYSPFVLGFIHDIGRHSIVLASSGSYNLIFEKWSTLAVRKEVERWSLSDSVSLPFPNAIFFKSLSSQ